MERAMAHSAVAATVPPPPDATSTPSAVTAPTPRRAWRAPLHVLAALFVGFLLLVTVGTLGGQSYRGVQDILRTAAFEEGRYIRDALGEKVGGILESAASQLALLAHSDLPESATLADRLKELPLILEALKRNTLIDASFVGYPNGEFILFRPLRDAEQRAAFSAPANSALLVQSRARDSADVIHGLYQFFDVDGRLLNSVVQNDYRFDPRSRPWYKDVEQDGGVVLTAPYPFFTTQKVGATMARRSASGKAVVGLDITLQSIAGTLENLRITPSTELAVID